MSLIDKQLHALGMLDTLAAQSSPLHRRDARAKLSVSLLFIIAVLSFNSYTISGLVPFILYPVCMAAWGRVPLGYLARRLCLAAPFVLFVGIFNPLLDTAIVMHVGGVPISAGWLSFLSILIRCALTISAAVLLVATAGFPALCAALSRLGLPAVMCTQLLFVHRYIFVLMQEASRMQRARDMRACGNKGKEWRIYAHMLGQLLLRTYDRAARMYQAMLCRGFTGTMPARHTGSWQREDTVFVLGWLGFFTMARLYNVPQLLGNSIIRVFV